MPLERFTGPDVPGLLARVRERLGPEAVLVSTRRMADPAMGYEVLAADPVTATSLRAQGASRRGARSTERPATYGPPRRFAPGERPSNRPAVPRPAAPRFDDEALLSTLPELPPLRSLTRAVGVATEHSFASASAGAPASEPQSTMAPGTAAPASFDASTPWPASIAPAPILGDPVRRRHRQPPCIALVGPTGAGKTTTLAKLANHPQVFAGLPVGLLCLDTYRVGAIEQLRIYAEIARLPLEVVYEPRELKPAVRRLRDCEVLLVDTAGRGPAAVADVDATWEQLARLAPVEVHVVVPAGLRFDVMRGIVDRHMTYGATHLLATKFDEFPDDAAVFDLASSRRIPMRWFTDGQEVPFDLQPAAPRLATARHPLLWGSGLEVEAA